MAMLKPRACPVCNVILPETSRAAHEKKHRPKARKAAKKINVGPVPPPIPLRVPPTAALVPQPVPRGEPPAAAGTWTCTLCNVTVNVYSKEIHEASSGHRKRPFRCWLCNVNITLNVQESHEAGRKHMARERLK